MTEIGVFGSYMRGENKAGSDLDIQVALTDPPRISLLGLVNKQTYLSDLLGLEVDVVLKDNLKKRIGQRILRKLRRFERGAGIVDKS